MFSPSKKIPLDKIGKQYSGERKENGMLGLRKIHMGNIDQTGECKA